MSDSYPSVGLAVDLNQIVQLQAQISALAASYGELATSAAAAGKASEAAAASSVARGQVAVSTAKATVAAEDDAAKAAKDGAALSLAAAVEAAQVMRAQIAEVAAARAAADAENRARIAATTAEELAASEAVRAQKQASLAAAVEAARIARAQDAETAAAQIASARAVRAEKQLNLAAAVEAAAIARAQIAEEKAAMQAMNATSPQASFVASLKEQAATLGMGKAALLEYKAAQLGVAAEAAPFIQKIKDSEKAFASGGIQMATFTRELVVMGREILRGNFSRLAGSATILGQSLGAMLPTVLLVGAAIAAVVAPIAVFAISANVGAEAIANFNNSLKLTGNYAGLTSSQLDAAATSIAASSHTGFGAAAKALDTLVASGKVYGDELIYMGDAAVKLGDLSAQSSAKIASSFLKMAESADGGLKELNDQYHFLSLAEYEHIQTLEKQGQKQQAVTELFKDFKGYLDQQTKDLGLLQQAIHGIAEAWRGATQGMLDYGKQDIDRRIAAQQKTLNNDRYPGVLDQIFTNPDGSTLAADQKKMDELRAEKDAAIAQGKKNEASQRQIDLHNQLDADAKASKTAFELAADMKKAHLDAINGLNDGPEKQAALASLPAYNAWVDKRFTGAKSPRSTDGQQNQIEKMTADVAGLRQEIASVSADPLSEIAAKIQKAGAMAAAQRQNGPGAAFANDAARLASQKEELTIRLALLDTSAKNTRQALLETEQATLQNAAREKGVAALDAYYSTARDSFSGYSAALDAQTNAVLQGKLAEDAMVVAQRYGVTSIDAIAEAYRRKTGVTAQEAQGVQDAAAKEVATTQARDRAAAAIAIETRNSTELTAALKAEHDMREQNARLIESTTLTTDQRAADPQARIYQQQALNVAKQNGVALTDQEALAQGRVLAAVDKQIADTAKLAISIQDAIQQAFVDTGKLDFKSLQDGFEKSIRKAVYNQLIAKPIEIVVNALVNMESQALQSVFQSAIGSIPGLSNIFGGGSNFGGDPATAAFQSSMFANASATSDLASKLSSLSSTAGPLLAASGVAGAIGSTIATALGASPQKANQAGMGAAIGEFLLGPIGAVIGGILGGVLGPKPSNFTATADFTATGTPTIGGDKPSAETTQAVTSIANTLSQNITTLQGLGINAAGIIKSIYIGQRDPSGISLSNGTTLHTAVGDTQALSDAMNKALLQFGTYTDPQMKALVDQMIAANDSFSQISTALQGYVQAQTDAKNVTLGLLQYTDPTAYATQTLQASQLARRQTLQQEAQAGDFTAAQLAQINATLPQLETKEIQAALDNVAITANGVSYTLKDFQAAQAAVITYVKNLATGALSPLSPQAQYSAAQADFATQLAAAQGGNYTALQGITTVADTYLKDAQQYFGSGGAYADVFNSVTGSLTALGNSTTAVDPQTEAINKANADLQAAIAASGNAIIAAIQATAPTTTAASTAAAATKASGGVDLSTLALAIAGSAEAIVKSQQETIGPLVLAILGQQKVAAALAGGLAATG